MSKFNYYEIESKINPLFGAKIYPINIHKSGAGWYLKRVSDDKALSPKEVGEIAGQDVKEELVTECNRLLNKEDHYE